MSDTAPVDAEVQTYNLVLVPGDGIGPEVIAAGRRVLDAAGRIFGFGIDWTEILVGGVAIDAYGTGVRDEDLDKMAASDAVYFGAIGDPKYERSQGEGSPGAGAAAASARIWPCTPICAPSRSSRFLPQARPCASRWSRTWT